MEACGWRVYKVSTRERCEGTRRRWCVNARASGGVNARAGGADACGGALLDEHAAVGDVGLVDREARGRRGLDVNLVDEEELGVALGLVEDRLPVGRGLHVAGEDRAVDLVGEGQLAAEREQLRLRELPARRLERVRAPLAALGVGQRWEEADDGAHGGTQCTCSTHGERMHMCTHAPTHPCTYAPTHPRTHAPICTCTRT